MAGFEEGGVPWLRSRLREEPNYTCPFCGEESLILSTGDIRDDDLRVEAYCNNSDCAVREMTILAMRVGGPAGRADIDALERIDAEASGGADIISRDRSILSRRRSSRN